MGKIKVTITGTASKIPKIKDDKTVDLIIKVDMSANVPKGLKSLGQSICLVHVGAKAWKKVATVVKDDSFYIIQGEVKSNVNSKNVPFLEVIAFDISIKPETPQKEQAKEGISEKPKKVEETEKSKQTEKVEVKKQEAISKKQRQESKDQKKSSNSKKNNSLDKKAEKNRTPMFKEWYTPEEVMYVSHEELIIIEDIHLKAKTINLNGILKAVSVKEDLNVPIVVRPKKDGKYSLVMGVKYCMTAKILNLKKVPIVIKDMNYGEFMKKYRIRVYKQD